MHSMTQQLTKAPRDPLVVDVAHIGVGHGLMPASSFACLFSPFDCSRDTDGIDRSWRWGPILGTHNGFISRANGFGLTEDLASAIYARAGPVNATHVLLPNQRYRPKDLPSPVLL